MTLETIPRSTGGDGGASPTPPPICQPNPCLPNPSPNLHSPVYDLLPYGQDKPRMPPSLGSPLHPDPFQPSLPDATPAPAAPASFVRDSSLSPDAALFIPNHFSAHRPKHIHWEDGSLSGGSDIKRSPSPLQTMRWTRSGAAPSMASTPPPGATVAAANPMPRRHRQHRCPHRRRQWRAIVSTTGGCDASRRGGATPPPKD